MLLIPAFIRTNVASIYGTNDINTIEQLHHLSAEDITFLSRILEPLCASIQLMVLSSDSLMNKFSQAANYVAGAIDVVRNSSNVPSLQVTQVTSNLFQVSRGSYYIGRGHSRFGSCWGGRDKDRDGRFFQWQARGDNTSIITHTSTISTLPSQGMARGYSYCEWSQLLAAQKQRIYCEKDHTNTAHTACQVRGVRQAILDNISDAVTRRWTVGAFNMEFTRICHTEVDCHFNISSLSQTSNSIILLSCSPADTWGVNTVAKILSYTEEIVQVSAYSPAIEKIENIPIVSAATAYDDAISGETYVVIINQTIFWVTFGQYLIESKSVKSQWCTRWRSSKTSYKRKV